LIPKPAPLTPETAEPILDIVAEALQQDDGLPYHPLSSLQGYDVLQVDSALKLRIANDFLLLSLHGREAELDDIAKQWETIPFHVVTSFVRDDERNKLKSVPKGSREYMGLQIKMSPHGMINDTEFSSLEVLSSFVKFCRHVGAADSLYWQKVYTRIGLPYEKRCPQGNDPVFN